MGSPGEGAEQHTLEGKPLGRMEEGLCKVLCMWKHNYVCVCVQFFDFTLITSGVDRNYINTEYLYQIAQS